MAFLQSILDIPYCRSGVLIYLANAVVVVYNQLFKLKKHNNVRSVCWVTHDWALLQAVWFDWPQCDEDVN